MRPHREPRMAFFALPLVSLRLLCYNVNTSLGLNLFFWSVLFEKHQPFGDCTVSERLANTFSAFLSYLERHNYERIKK